LRRYLHSSLAVRVEARDALESDSEIRDSTEQSMELRLVDDWTGDLGLTIDAKIFAG